MALTRWRWLAIHDRETSLVDLIRILNLRLRQLADFLATGGNGSAADEINAVEAYLWNAGDPLVAGDSDWVFVPFSFTITLAEIVADIAGSLVVDVYASSYSAWSGFTLISGAAPITLAGVAKAHPPLTGWTKTFTGGTYLRFTVSGTPVTVRKATISLELTLPNSVLTVTDTGVVVTGPVGGVLSGTLPNPGFAEDMATQAELNVEAAARASADTTESTARSSGDTAVQAFAIQRANHTGTQTASTISDFNSASRAQTEAELVAGANITITPASSGATRTLTIASNASASTAPSNVTNLQAWYKADAGVYKDAGVTLAVDGDTVQRWADQSGNGNHANQATAGQRPRYNTTSVRGGPSLYFDNTDDNFPTITVAAPYTIFIVYNVLAADTNRRALSGSNNWLVGHRAGLQGHFAGGFISQTSCYVPRGLFSVSCVRNTSAKSQHWVQGIDISEATASVTAPGTLYIGCAGFLTNEPVNGYIQEVIVFNASLTDARVEEWNAYLRSRWLS